jgi:uncharacterized membrane protein (DUF106 family)
VGTFDESGVLTITQVTDMLNPFLNFLSAYPIIVYLLVAGVIFTIVGMVISSFTDDK